MANAPKAAPAAAEEKEQAPVAAPKAAPVAAKPATSKKTVTNKSKGLRYVGGVKILPGRSADVDAAQLDNPACKAEIEQGLLEVK